jgi:hypothetical protein
MVLKNVCNKKFKAVKNVYKNLVSFVLYCGKANRNRMDLSFFGIAKQRNWKDKPFCTTFWNHDMF